MWQLEFIDEIQKIDQEQAPHGMYALPDLLRDGKRILPLAHILGGEWSQADKHPSLNPFDRFGWQRHYAKGSTLTFTIRESVDVSMQIENHASTKVRCYGDTHRLDKSHAKRGHVTANQIEKWVSKLPKDARNKYSRRYHGVLLVAYVPKPVEFKTLLGKAADARFLDRYQLTFITRDWSDFHQRDFHMGLFLWTHDSGKSEFSVGQPSEVKLT